MTTIAVEASVEGRILAYFHENPWSTWFACEKALGITADASALVAAFDVRERLNRDHLFEVFHPDGLPSIYRLTDAGVERLMAVTGSGELPNVEPVELRA